MTADKFKEDIKSLRDKELLDARENSTLKSPPIMIELAHLPERVHVSQLMLAALKSPHRTAGTVVGILAIDPSSSSSRDDDQKGLSQIQQVRQRRKRTPTVHYIGNDLPKMLQNHHHAYN